MKRVFSILAALLVVITVSATNLAGKRIYVNPGHGSFGPNDRPMATIPYPNLSSTGMPDTCGFYESNTNLWKCQYLRDRLVAAGATVVMSREACGPWPYQKVNGQYPDYSWDNYQNLPNYTQYNKNLSVICEEVESGNYDIFISVHSNANADGTTTNYPIWLYRGYDAATTQFEQNCKAFGAAMWPYRFEPMTAGFDHHSAYSATNMALRGDVSFMGSGSNSTRNNGNVYYGYYGVLKHGTVGGIFEGYFHTYQPARHRALNIDCCHMEGYCYYRGIIDYFNADKDTKGYILGLIKDEHERISNPLYTYAPKMHDQWLPLNGAVVSLYKGTTKIAEYTVDDCYNGVFYFGDLEPGNDYWVDATCDGYKPMWDEYKAPITVTANTVTYPRIYLEQDSYQEEVEQPKTYPDPEQPASIGVADVYNMTQSFADESLDVLNGKTIRRTILRNDSTMFVLALDAQNNPYLYLINPSLHTLTATLPTDFCAVSSQGKLKLSDIAVTAEGVLIGCNEENVTFTPSNVFKVYKWTLADGVWSGDVWLTATTNETAGNFNTAIAGTTMAYAGTLEEGSLYFTAYTIGSDAHAVRYVCYSISAGAYAGGFRNQDATHKLSEMGHDIQFTVSPTSDDCVIITAANIAPMEWKVVTMTASAPIITTMPDAFVGVKGVSFFKYAKHNLMTAPKMVAGQNAGIALYDITEGFDVPQEIELTNSTLEAQDATDLAATGMVNGEDITLYLLRGASLSRFTTVGEEQPLSVGVYAYDLHSEVLSSIGLSAEDGYKFEFKTNAEVNLAHVVLYDAEGDEVSSYPATMNGKEGYLELANSDLPGEANDVFTWAVEVAGNRVARWGRIFSDNSMLRTSTTRVFNAVDRSPESDYFGRIYIMRRAGSSASAERPYNGLYAYDQNYELVSANLLKGGCEFGNPARLAVDGEGFIYQSDWADNYSGVYVIDPANLEGTFHQFFLGTRASSGLFTNNGKQVGSSTPGLGIYGTGADSKLIVYNEDAGGSLPANGLAIYNIGQPDSSIVRTWGDAPSSTISLTMQGNTEGTPVGTSHGVFVSQHRTSGNNNKAAASLMFMDYSGQMQMASCNEPYDEIIDGSDGGGYAVSADEKVLVMQGGMRQFYVFDISWEGDKPVLTLRYEYEHGIQTIRQINFDYAGNLVCSGETGLYVFAMPHESNVVLTPAKKSLVIVKSTSEEGPVAVQSVSLDQTSLALLEGEMATLTATVLPANADDRSVTWSSSDEEVAIVEDGVVTAVAEGEAVITVTTTDGGLTATCIVQVTIIDGVYQLTIPGISYSGYVIHNEYNRQLNVFAVTGHLVASGNADISLQNMPAGTYLVVTADGRAIKVLR